MPSRLSIFSSRIFGSALIWTVLAVALIEWRAARTLPGRFSSHEVDQLLYDLDQGRIPADDTVFLGDSVGRQIANGILRQHPGAFVPLACNAAIEIPGQYYLLQRYLENHPAPRRLILMMGHPLAGELQGDYTENYVQRVFLRWREIAGLTRARRSLRFGLVMAAYKLSPAFRFRLRLQKAVPFLETPDPYFGWLDLSAAPAAPEKPEAFSLLELIAHNHAVVRKFMAKRLPAVKVFDLEGTYLQWMDFRALGKSAAELKAANEQQALVFFDEGTLFGPEGAGFERMNLATSTAALEAALERLARCYGP